MPKYILMKFDDNGNLIKNKVVKLNTFLSDEEEQLYEELETFERECINKNIGTELDAIGFLTEKEFNKIKKELK